MKKIMGSPEDTHALVERAKTGDRTSFEALAGRETVRLESFIRSRLGVGLKNRVEIQDILQEALLRACRSIASFEYRHADSLFQGLSGIAAHVLFETASRDQRDPAQPLDFEAAGSTPTPSKILRREERFDRLQIFLNSLSPDHSFNERARESCYELALKAGVIGMVDDLPAEFRTNPKTWEGFGRG